MPRLNVDELADRRRAEAEGVASVRLVDLEFIVYAEDELGERTGEVVAGAGGLWDRRRREYVGPAREVRGVSAHPGQLEALRWFAAWLEAHATGTLPPGADRIHAVLLAGGQRGGKTYDAVLFVVLYVLACPGAIVWIVSPSTQRKEELEDLLRRLLPADWYTALGAPHHRWKLVNGSKIVMRSAHDPDALKVGDCDLVVLNEAQQLPERAYTTARGRTAAAGGLVVVAANPPTRPIGEWVGNFAAEAKAGRRPAKLFELDPFDNPHVDQEVLRSIQSEVDEHTFDVEIRGIFRAPRDSVFFNWSRTDNERPTPETGEITAEFLRWAEGREFDRAVGVDVQRVPHMTSVEMRFFVNPAAPAAPERYEWCLAWFTADATLEAATERDLACAWLDLGWDPERTLLVVDASADWQFTERQPFEVAKLREEVKGRGSADVFRAMGFRHIVKPDRNQERNPDVVERCRAMTSRICTAAPGPYGQRFLFADPSLRELSKAIRSWPAEHGRPSRRSRYAHRCDAASYLVSRLFPRRTRPGTPAIKVLSKFTRRNAMKDW